MVKTIEACDPLSPPFLNTCCPHGPVWPVIPELKFCTSNLLRYVFWQDVGGKRLNIYCKALGITTRRQEKGQLLPTKQTKSTICLFASRIGLLEKTKLGNCRIPIAKQRQECWNTQIILWEKGSAVNIGRKIVQFEETKFLHSNPSAESHLWSFDRGIFPPNIQSWIGGWPDAAY